MRVYRIERPTTVRSLALAACLILLSGSLPASANPKYAGMVYDVIAERTLYADDAAEQRHPASMTKAMTLYLVFEELAAGNITLDTRFTISKYASQRPPSKLGFKPGATIKVRDAILSLVTKSANDVATAVAENIAGSEPAFARRMTRTAERLGMTSTVFRNASGLPNAKQVTTAEDMIKLGIALQRDFPQYYGVFQTRKFSYRGRSYGNYNRLLGSVPGVDGIKTGFIRASGFNLLTSIRRDGRHLVAVVFGGRTGASRNRHMRDLIARTLPKARRGKPMVFAAWRGDGPPPVPRNKPDLRPVFAARLLARSARADPIGEKVMAFARQARSTATPVGNTNARQAIEAVIAGAGTQSAPGNTTEFTATAFAASDKSASERSIQSVMGTSAVRASAPGGAVPHRGSTAGSSRRHDEAEAGDRVAAAFELATYRGGAPGGDALAAAIERAGAAGQLGHQRSEHAAAEMRAPGKAPWQIQIAAVPSKRAAQAALADAARTIPALRKHDRLTVPVTTEDGLIYRARFGGFSTRDAALAACKRFANHGTACWPTSM